MTVLSVLRGVRPLASTISSSPALLSRQLATSIIRRSDEGRFVIKPSNWYWQKYKDLFHFYFMLGVIPLTALVFVTNIFIGPATLTETPPGYIPKQWEYNRHPISRWLLKYTMQSHQEVYEKNLHYSFVEEEKRQMRLMAWKVEALMRERGDYPNYYTSRSIMSKYLRSLREEDEQIVDRAGISVEIGGNDES